ncbi:hypothetical protein AB1K91_13855 [Terribacillus sp. 179-K 1B1 HS]|uniref:hypothetical protein n=1 Tax=Terribacillus sp. 179-K 1B1 HS TaxID=3142388 RepID=UPI0039A1396A
MRGSDAQQHAFAASRLDAIRHRGEPASLAEDSFMPDMEASPAGTERKKLQERLKQS